jgi:hypothetical protein
MGISDQMDMEKVLHCKYLAAAQETEDEQLKTCYTNLANQHKQNYGTLLGYLD